MLVRHVLLLAALALLCAGTSDAAKKRRSAGPKLVYERIKDTGWRVANPIGFNRVHESKEGIDWSSERASIALSLRVTSQSFDQRPPFDCGGMEHLRRPVVDGNHFGKPTISYQCDNFRERRCEASDWSESGTRSHVYSLAYKSLPDVPVHKVILMVYRVDGWRKYENGKLTTDPWLEAFPGLKEFRQMQGDARPFRSIWQGLGQFPHLGVLCTRGGSLLKSQI